MRNSIGQTTSGDESALKPVPDSLTGELKFYCSEGPRSDGDAAKCYLQRADMMGRGRVSHVTLLSFHI